jgi:TolB-like protein
LGLIAAASYYMFGGHDRIGSVAVLPFANAAGDPNLEYLSDGIAESVMDSLAQLQNLASYPATLLSTTKDKMHALVRLHTT